ncbi:MAG: hypothetical protein QM752_07550 [Gammaproteobacteria bacterium]
MVEKKDEKGELLDRNDKRLMDDYPLLDPIRNIQAQAVKYLYLPNAENHAKGRWKLLKNFFLTPTPESKASKETHSPKAMELKYFGEWVTDGKITFISNSSGHYQPTTEHLLNCLRFLKRHNVDLSETIIADDTQKKNFTSGGSIYCATYE